jgi:bacillopeptidase F (M6 metalloprotease family)
MYLTYSGISPTLVSNFRGDAYSGMAPYAGSYELWGGRGDLLETKATLAAPVTLGTSASLSFWTNYQIEEFWDFAFVQVSTDGGATWTSLANADTTSQYDPAAIGGVIANVPGFTGSSGGWKQESFDLAAYAGQSVLFRFLYITDWATNEAGFYVDEITVSDSGGTLFYDGLEAGSGNWMLEGFEHTTGLAENDWGLTFLNPRYLKGKFVEYQILDKQPLSDGTYQRDLTTLATSTLNSDAVTVIVSNHQPEAVSSAAGYRLLVSKDKRIK